jgi:hypothetical protein
MNRNGEIMKSSLLSIYAIALITTLALFNSCGGDDDNPINPNSDTSYVRAKVTGNFVRTFNTGLVKYSVYQTNRVLLETTTNEGDITLIFPLNQTGTFTVDGVQVIANILEPASTLSILYTGYTGTIIVTVNDDKKVKGTFEFNAKTTDGTKSVVVKEGEFQYIVK